MPKNKKQTSKPATRSTPRVKQQRQQQQQQLGVRKTKGGKQLDTQAQEQRAAKKQRVEDEAYVELSSESESESSSEESDSGESASSREAPPSKGLSPFEQLCATKTAASSDEAPKPPTFKAEEHRDLVKELRANLSSFFTPRYMKAGTKKTWCQPIRFELVVADAGESVKVRIFGNYAMMNTFQLEGHFEDRDRHPEAQKGNWTPYAESECGQYEKHFVADLNVPDAKAVLLSVIVSLTIFSQHLVLCQEGLVEFLQSGSARAEDVQNSDWVIPRVGPYISEIEKFLLQASANKAKDVQNYIKVRARVARYLMAVVEGAKDAEELRNTAEKSARSFYKDINPTDVMITDKFGTRFALGHRSLHFFQANKKNKLTMMQQ